MMQDIRNLVDQIAMGRGPDFCSDVCEKRATAPCPTCGALGQYHKFVFHTQLSRMEIETMLWNLVELAMKTQKAIDGAHSEQTP
jgi:hypothetical protein